MVEGHYSEGETEQASHKDRHGGQDILAYPDAYPYERAKRLGVSKNGIWHALRRLGVTYKKSLSHPKACPAARTAFQKRLQNHRLEGKPLVFLDESGFAHDMPRTHGYG